MTVFAVTVDAEELLQAAGRLDRVNGARLTEALVPVVNAVTSAFDTKARRAMNAGINLPDQYVSSKMTTSLATSVPRAEIVAAGPGRAGRQGLTILGRYNARTITGSLARPGGVKVEVTRGQVQTLTRRAFLMRLKKGANAGDQFGVFERLGADRKDAAGNVVKRNWKHLYAVSPYSLFRFQVRVGEEKLADALTAAALAALTPEVQP